MTQLSWVFIAICVGIALVDWCAVATDQKKLEYIAKPLTMVPLIVVAVICTPAVPAMRWWFVAALLLSLLGDVLLMLPREELFVAGLGSFLVAHVAYVVGLNIGGVSGLRILIGAVLAGTVLLAIGPTIVKGASERDKVLGPPVAVYMGVLGAMFVMAVGAGPVVGIVGAALFMLSDACIGWSQFVAQFTHSRLAIMITYHVAQILLVVSMTVTR